MKRKFNQTRDKIFLSAKKFIKLYCSFYFVYCVAGTIFFTAYFLVFHAICFIFEQNVERPTQITQNKGYEYHLYKLKKNKEISVRNYRSWSREFFNTKFGTSLKDFVKAMNYGHKSSLHKKQIKKIISETNLEIKNE